MIAELAATQGWTLIGAEEWEFLRRQIPELRTDHVAASGFPAEAPWYGVRQHTLEELETSLCDIAKVYAERADLRDFCRKEVIRAKDRARIISKSSKTAPEKRTLKAGMVEWMLVWLSDPALFPVWSKIRRQRVSTRD